MFSLKPSLVFRYNKNKIRTIAINNYMFMQHQERIGNER